MTGAKIEAISVYLPSRCLTNADLDAEFPGWSSERLARKVGVLERHVAAEGETAMDMAVRAAEKLFEEHSYDREKIDFILLCTQSPEYLLPTTACIIQHKLGLRTTAGALDFGLGCSGYVYGLSLANGLIAAGSAKNVLLLTSDTYTRYLHPKDHNNRTIFGDGATATIVSAAETPQLGAFVFGTNGAGAPNLIIRNGGARHPYDSAAEINESRTGSISNDNCLYMNGPEIFNYVMDLIPRLLDDTLAAAGLKLEDIDHFVLHQANAHMLNYLRNQLGIDKDKFFNDMTKVGNTVSSTIPIGLAQLFEEGKLKAGDKVMLVGYGVGYSWASAIATL